MVALALSLGASRVEIAHAQYYGWALKNRAALMPSAEQVKRAARRSRNCGREHHGEIVIDAVVPDYYARLPKPCVGGWGRRSLNVTPGGKVLPCHAAESIPGLEFWSVREHVDSPTFGRIRRRSTPSAAPPGCRAMRQLRPARDRFRRLPLPGLRLDRRRPRHRSGLSSGARARPGRIARPQFRTRYLTTIGGCSAQTPATLSPAVCDCQIADLDFALPRIAVKLTCDLGMARRNRLR